MKIAHLKGIITPPIGSLIAGYGPNDVSVMKYDELMFHGFCLEAEGRKYLLISYDLLGLNRESVVTIRKACAELIGGTEADVMLSCTHTHGGPHTRYHFRTGLLDTDACKLVLDRTVEAVAALKDSDFTGVTPYFYSKQRALNINRRYCGPENVCTMVFNRIDLLPLADGPTDPEIGMLFFLDDKKRPVETVVNYAAHPLAAHAGGDSTLAISPDYPALVRKYIGESTGSGVTFVSGAAGDQFPKDFEAGFCSLDNIARPLATETLQGCINAKRNPEKFSLGADAKVRTLLKSFPAKIRPDLQNKGPIQPEMGTCDLELQFMSIGDLCLVGVPCELVAELGLEIKWHSPFRKTFICYNSTDYANYINGANAIVAGGYEAEEQLFTPDTGLQLVCKAVEAMNELKSAEK